MYVCILIKSEVATWVVLGKRCSENFCKIYRKHLCHSLFFNEVAVLRPATLLKKRLWHSCFPVNFVKFQKTTFLQNTFVWLLLWMNTVSIRKQNSTYSVDVSEVMIIVIYGFTKRSSVKFVWSDDYSNLWVHKKVIC